MPNISGHHPLTPSLVLFLHNVRNTFLRFMRGLGAQKWVIILSGMFTISCAILWTQKCCSSLAWIQLMKMMFPRSWTQINHHFNNFSLVNLARMESHSCNMKVEQIPSFLSACNSLSSCQNSLPGSVTEIQVW